MTAGSFDRRRGRRAGPEEHGLVSARIRPGYDVQVVDISGGGVLVEGNRRLMPGTIVELQLQPEGRPVEVVRGHVLRCRVSSLRESAVSYRGAIAFERCLWRF